LAQQTIALDVNGVKIETTEAEVIQKLGKPSSRKRSVGNERQQGSLLRLRYPGLIIEFESLGVVAAATVTSPKWSFSGIRIGANVSEVQKNSASANRREKKVWIIFTVVSATAARNSFFRKASW
jgi:hypothetical protein